MPTQSQIEDLTNTGLSPQKFMEGWCCQGKKDRQKYHNKMYARKKAAELKKLKGNMDAEVEIKVLTEASLCQIFSSTQRE